MKDIPVHQLKERASLGLEIWRYDIGDARSNKGILDAHRDDHYIFFVVDAGDASLMIDFTEVGFFKNTLYYVLPGQVHHGVRYEQAAGWFLAVDTMLVLPDYRKVFEGQLELQKPYILDDALMTQCTDLLHLLRQRFSDHGQSTFNISVVHSLLQSFIGIAAGCYAESNYTTIKVSRPVELSQMFKQLLVDNYVAIKNPSVYAGMLNVSESYLNEALKKVTGFSVSYWILNEVMLEAKRLLYYSECNVKEVAHALGYDDHAYFSRLFKKSEGVTPLTFRTTYRK
ncbi:MAG: helix-turn-helix domain-containing protein [Mucilaginibacter sp.]|jgi:AraC-like DNA-binding protein|uniref:helix-turn-helix domain-containing protein n=1 Tax=Mucilaginibacter sp. TaxID=1882438 RepID=UPI00356295FC